MAKNHALNLGKLVGNLQSLETLLRFFLKKKNPNAATKSMAPFVVGQSRDEDEFTNYDTLGVLIEKYNECVVRKDRSLLVDSGVVRLRDLLAHGRVSAEAADETRLTIVKFSKPCGGNVTVVDSALMSEQWFVENQQWVREQLDLVASANAIIP